MTISKVWVDSRINEQGKFLAEYQVDTRAEVSSVPTTDAIGSEILVLEDVSFWRLAWDSVEQTAYWKELV